MLPLDHIPFPGPDMAATAAAFSMLGFTVSPQAAYTSPDFPEARWASRCVFLRSGWFDLLHAPEAPAEGPVSPGAALFLTDDLAGAAKRLGEFRQRRAYALVRAWDQAPELGHEHFELFDIRERVCPLGLSVIAHHYPCPDTLPAWFEHHNTASALTGLIFRDAQPGAYAQRASAVLDISGFGYWPADRFRSTFGDIAATAVCVRVDSLATLRRWAEASGLAFRESEGRLNVTAPAPLACGFQFFEA